MLYFSLLEKEIEVHLHCPKNTCHHYLRSVSYNESRSHPAKQKKGKKRDAEWYTQDFNHFIDTAFPLTSLHYNPNNAALTL